MAAPTLFDHEGNPVTLRAPLASGGEGVVHTLAGDSTQLAKLYHERPDAAKVQKLNWMTAQASAELCALAAWPTATLYEGKGGPVVGFLMPRFDGYRAVHMLYSPAHRRASFPEADWSFLVTAAMNCAAAFDVVHEQGHVIGDVNQSNVLVSHQALACLIDCDSFQVSAGGRVFRSEVGVGPYTPPELQGAHFREVDRTADHDRFGLAVLIFHLLFMGRHPFAGRFLGAGEMSLEQAIAEYRFAYSEVSSDTQMAAPPFTLPLRAVGPALADLFERAFLRTRERRGSSPPSSRPTAAEWHAALSAFRAQLAPCSKDAGYKVPQGWAGCPWCAFVEQGGPNFFLGVGVDAAGYQVDAALLSRLWGQIQAQKPVDFPRPTLVVTAQVPAVAPPTRGERLGRRLARVPWQQVAGGVLNSAALLLWLSVAFFTSGGLCGSVLVFVVAFYLAGLATNKLRLPLARLQNRLKARFLGPERASPRDRAGFLLRMEDLNDEWEQAVSRYRVEFRRLKDGLRSAQKEAAGLQDAFLAERYELEKAAAARQPRQQGGSAGAAQEAQARELYLRNTFLSDHKIPGFGSGRLTLLASYGVETAFDISEENLLPIRGIGQKLRQTLLGWKEQRFEEFRYDPSMVLPGTRLELIPAEQMRALVRRYKAREEAVRSQLQRGAQDLAALGRHHEQELQMIVQKRNELATRAAQLGIDPGRLSR